MSAPSFPTLQDYTFDLASRLQQAASQSLKEFEASITRDGFDWLDGYMENLEAQDRRPIAELIKTPSRTATVKRTRTLAAATETAARDRAEQIRRFNARIALSPLMKSPENRQPFSPLNAQQLLDSPMNSPLKGKAKAGPKTLKVEDENNTVDSPVKSKSKRTRIKKDVEPAASKSTRRAVRGPAPKAPTPPREPTPEPEPVQKEPTPVREPTPRESTPVVEAEPEPAPVEREPTPEPVVIHREPTPEPVIERDPTPERQPSPEPEPEPIEEDIPSEPVRHPTPRQPTPEPVREPTPDLMDLNSEPAEPIEPACEPSPDHEEDELMEDVTEQEPKEVLLSESEDESQKAPVRVRSSWLSQALGNQVARPSVAQRTSMHDYNGLRSSTMPPKRKSEETEEAKEKRPDKVARIDPATASPAPYDRKAGSAASLPAAMVSTPAAASTTKAQATTDPNIKIAKALEDMRAAALVRVKSQRAAPAAAAAAVQAPAAPVPGGGGFLRGLGGLFGFQNDDAARQKREAEDRKREEEDRKARAAAEAELNRVLDAFREEEQREMDEDAVNDSIAPPVQDLIDIGDDFDAIPDDLGSSALGSAGLVIDIDFAGSTTPPGTPPTVKKHDTWEAQETLESTPTPKRKPAVPRKAPNRPTSTALASSSSQLFKTADRMASKIQGQKPPAPPVKSVARAAEAAKKEQAAKDRREALREQTERKKREEKQRKAEEERAAAEAERKRAAAEAEAKRQRLAEAEKARKEREARIQRQERQKAEREEAARKADEARKAEEAARKEEAERARKAALQRSQLAKSGGIKRIIPAPKTPGKTHSRPPSTFRTAERASVQRLGPPQRTSQAANAAAGPSRASTTLQQQRATLQAQLDRKAVEAELEDDSGNMSLPSIRSEYSDSDDEPSESDFKRPAWAESPALRHALEAQANVNPDELFGPIKPLRMEELFKDRSHKFRQRTSSANWHGADRLTEAEERDYARRMGFKPVNAPK